MKRSMSAGEWQEGLCLHDALVKDVEISEINYAERSVRIVLNAAQAMSDVKALRLERCRRLEMDDIAGCWWIGERLTCDESGVILEAELSAATGEKRRLFAQCQRMAFE